MGLIDRIGGISTAAIVLTAAGAVAGAAATGLLRTPNNVAIVNARDAAGANDIQLLKLDSSNVVRIGDKVHANGGVTLDVSANQPVVLEGPTCFVQATPDTGAVIFGGNCSNPSILLAGPNPNGAGVGLPITTQAAKVGSAANGGDITLSMGAGDGVGTQGQLLLNARWAGGFTNPWAWANNTITTPTTGSITLSAGQYVNPRLRLSMSLTGNITVVFPNQPGSWRVSMSGVTFNAHTVAFQSGSTTSATVASITTTTQFVDVETYGTNTIDVGTL